MFVAVSVLLAASLSRLPGQPAPFLSWFCVCGPAPAGCGICPAARFSRSRPFRVCVCPVVELQRRRVPCGKVYIPTDRRQNVWPAESARSM
eukprot:5626275-Lingulodinium_polyedra.AAC.1